MTEKELRDNIMRVMLKYRDESDISINEYSSKNKIKITSDEQKELLYDFLKEKGYIDAEFFLSGDGYFTITSSGIDYAENFL